MQNSVIPKNLKNLSETKRAYWVAVVESEGVGPATFSSLLTRFGSAKAIWEADPKMLLEAGASKRAVDSLFTRRKSVSPKNHLKNLAKLGIRAVCWPDDEYPKPLKSISNPPSVLFVRGKLLPADQKSIAIVGTRKPTAYGREVVYNLTTQLVLQGFTIVSGLARGIDGIAHKVALEQNGRTIAVLGGGPDKIYPAEHTALADNIAKHGAVISEFTPGFRPLRGQFPLRNRIISGLSLAVLVIEGESSSGTKHTANHAFKQGRPVFAVPGPITSRLSDAPNDLIQMGAKAVRSVSDIVSQLNLGEISANLSPKVNPNEKDIKFEFKQEKIIYEALKNGQLEVDEIVRMSNLNTQAVSATLSLMEIKGIVRNLGNGVYCRS
jgi:DNA processing protein